MTASRSNPLLCSAALRSSPATKRSPVPRAASRGRPGSSAPTATAASSRRWTRRRARPQCPRTSPAALHPRGPSIFLSPGPIPSTFHSAPRVRGGGGDGAGRGGAVDDAGARGAAQGVPPQPAAAAGGIAEVGGPGAALLRHIIPHRRHPRRRPQLQARTHPRDMGLGCFIFRELERIVLVHYRQTSEENVIVPPNAEAEVAEVPTMNMIHYTYPLTSADSTSAHTELSCSTAAPEEINSHGGRAVCSGQTCLNPKYVLDVYVLCCQLLVHKMLCSGDPKV